MSLRAGHSARSATSRGLAANRDFDSWSGGQACSADTIGHTGFAATGLWIDWQCERAWMLLTDRVHPTRHADRGIVALRT